MKDWGRGVTLQLILRFLSPLAQPLHVNVNGLTDIFETWRFVFEPLCKKFLGFDLPKNPRAATRLALAEVVTAA